MRVKMTVVTAQSELLGEVTSAHVCQSSGESQDFESTAGNIRGKASVRMIHRVFITCGSCCNSLFKHERL